MLRALQAHLGVPHPKGVLSTVIRLWNHEFHDARIILEQQGELRYFAITRGFQRLVVRLLMLAAAAAAMVIVALIVVAGVLQLEKQRLERSHQEIYLALLGASRDDASEHGETLTEDQMLMLAQTIRDRDLEIRRYVNSATSALETENSSLQMRLDASGLTAKAIKIIQSSNPVGGFQPEPPRNIDPLLKTNFAEHSAVNRELKEILSALPVQLPVKDAVTTSTFGIRKHPIHGAPRFHAGVDLISNSNDDVFPAKPGKVVMAGAYNSYGNTVIVRHDRGVETLYAHLASISVREGQDVDMNTVLGQIGNSGASTGKHLHFEVSVGGYPVDPLKVITTAQYVQQTQE